MAKLIHVLHPGIKNADENELRSIASDPDQIHMYNVNDFKFLVDIVDDVTNNLCNSVKGPGTMLYDWSRGGGAGREVRVLMAQWMKLLLGLLVLAPYSPPKG